MLKEDEEYYMKILHGTVVFKNKHEKAEIVKNILCGFKEIADKHEWAVTIDGTQKNDSQRYLKTCVYGIYEESFDTLIELVKNEGINKVRLSHEGTSRSIDNQINEVYIFISLYPFYTQICIYIPESFFGFKMPLTFQEEMLELIWSICRNEILLHGFLGIHERPNISRFVNNYGNTGFVSWDIDEKYTLGYDWVTFLSKIQIEALGKMESIIKRAQNMEIISRENECAYLRITKDVYESIDVDYSRLEELLKPILPDVQCFQDAKDFERCGRHLSPWEVKKINNDLYFTAFPEADYESLEKMIKRQVKAQNERWLTMKNTPMYDFFYPLKNSNLIIDIQPLVKKEKGMQFKIIFFDKVKSEDFNIIRNGIKKDEDIVEINMDEGNNSIDIIANFGLCTTNPKRNRLINTVKEVVIENNLNIAKIVVEA